MKFKVFSVIFILLITASALIPSFKASDSISKKVFRLHIIANSDSKEDQKLKMLVRNRVLNDTESLFKDVTDKNSAIDTALDNLIYIQKIAENEVIKNGYNYDVNVIVDNEYFSTRKYEKFILPAGMYDCLKIIIGEGKGHNYWCVMFPSVCVSSSSEEIESIMNDEERKLIDSDKYIVKFKAIEIYQKIKSKL